MGDQFDEELFAYIKEENLDFTKEDRAKTLNKIKEEGDRNKAKTGRYFGGRHVSAVAGTVMALILAIGILIPAMYSGNESSQGSLKTQQTSTQESASFSALLVGQDATHHRSSVHILFTYNHDDQSIKLVPIPRDTYVKRFNAEGEMIEKGKLLNVSALNSNPEAALRTVSNLFDIPIDYYSVVPAEEIYGSLGMSERGGNTLLENGMGDLIEEQLSFPQFKKIIKESKTNIPDSLFNKFQVEDRHSEYIQLIHIEKGVEEKLINGTYYIEINQDLLEGISKTLKQHVGES